jgi:hypothetical protein
MCDYCLNDKQIVNEGEFNDCEIRIDYNDKEIVFVVDDKEMVSYVQWAKINFCPMCGEAL